MSGPVHAGGLFASSRRLLGTVLEIFEVRLELLGTEVELEKRRLFDGLLWTVLGLLVLSVGLLLLCGFVLLLISETYRVAAAGTMALLFLLGGVLLLRQAQRRLQTRSGLFATSVAELKRDRAGLVAEDQHEQP